LAVDQPGDAFEREADHVSDRVMRMPAPRLQREGPDNGTWDDHHKEQSGQKHERIQLMRVGGGGSGQAEAPPAVHKALRSPGQPLDAATRAFMEPRFGHDFSRVRVHTGAAAEQSAQGVNAHAYTVGKDIVFGSGRFTPATHEGGRLLAHELTHVVQQSAFGTQLQRAPANKPAPPPSKMTEAEAEAWFREMNVDEAFADPSQPWAEGDPVMSDQAEGEALEDSLQQSLTPEEMHRQLLVRRAQPLGATAYQAADPKAAIADMQRKIKNLQGKIRTRKAQISKLKKQGPSAKAEIDKVKAEIGSFEDEVKSLNKARKRLPDATKFSQMGKGAEAGTGRITYAGIQIETAEGKRIALEFAETNATEHAEEAMIKEIESKLTKEQLRGSRVTVVGDQVVCGERCAPALSSFAERNGIESVDGIVFQRRQLIPPPADFIGPQDLASPRTTLRGMTEATSEGKEMFKRELPIYRRPPAGPAAAAAESGVEHAAGSTAAATAGSTAAAGAEKGVTAGVEHAAAGEGPGLWARMAKNFAKELKSMTPAKVAKFGKNFVVEGVKGYVVGKAVEHIIGDSPLEEDLAALDAANHAPHNDLPERIRAYEKEAIGLLPTQVAIIVAGAVRFSDPISPDFLYEATVQENKRKYEKFKEEYGDSDEASRLYDQSQKAADDFANGLTPF
jgi:hypothetical protein